MRKFQSLLIIVFLFSQTKLIAQQFPRTSWEYNSKPEKNGWDTAKFKSLRKFVIDSTQITGMMIIHKVGSQLSLNSEMLLRIPISPLVEKKVF